MGKEVINHEIPLFKKGMAYKRTLLHDAYQGSRMAGISRPKNRSFIMLFTRVAVATEIAAYYADGWRIVDGEERFAYSGEGKAGDMTWSSGNAALRDHKQEKKHVFLFGAVPEMPTYWRCYGEFELAKWVVAPRQGEDKVMRNAIEFELKEREVGLRYSDKEVFVDATAAEAVGEQKPIYCTIQSKVPGTDEVPIQIYAMAAMDVSTTSVDEGRVPNLIGLQYKPMLINKPNVPAEFASASESNGSAEETKDVMDATEAANPPISLLQQVADTPLEEAANALPANIKLSITTAKSSIAPSSSGMSGTPEPSEKRRKIKEVTITRMTT
jgi:hypothetical protein